MTCFHCKKKVVILITCKCEKNFCVKHQLPEKHECCFIYEKHVIQKLTPPKKIDTI
jgi:predicted nucleic acid binding AN1-type Zn finger protein